MIEKGNGIWIGENATVAIINDFRISFLRIKKDLIISVLYHNDYGTIGVTYGFGIGFEAYAFVSAKNPDTGVVFNNSDDAEPYLKNHSADKIEIADTDSRLIYTIFDGKKFELALAEKIDMNDFKRINEVDNSLTVAQKMALWEVGNCFEYADGCFNARIDTQKYSILFSFNIAEKWIYCRVGQNGYCEKGRAMFSTVCIRQDETRMIKNNLLSIEEYKPVEDYFVNDGCAFPPDGGWYWSVKEITDDIIYLNGCGGDIYEIHRIKNMQ